MAKGSLSRRPHDKPCFLAQRLDRHCSHGANRRRCGKAADIQSGTECGQSWQYRGQIPNAPKASQIKCGKCQSLGVIAFGVDARPGVRRRASPTARQSDNSLFGQAACRTRVKSRQDRIGQCVLGRTSPKEPKLPIPLSMSEAPARAAMSSSAYSDTKQHAPLNVAQGMLAPERGKLHMYMVSATALDR